ncbi:MAG: hypothetical protein ABIR59_11900 [Gemmatimonadales bacterium]
MHRFLAALTIAFALVGCRGEPQANAQSLGQAALEALVDSVMPSVASATGLPFRSKPAIGVRSREQVRGYLLAKLDQELPPARLEGITAAYRLLGMIPDTLDVGRLIVDLYTEQVAGFYDPDSSMLYAVQGADRTQLRLILAHELVHALQHQYVALDSMMRSRDNADRLAAAQAVFEGQATLVSMFTLVPDTAALANDAFWDTYRDQIRMAQAGMKVFASAPLVIREGLIFPYVGGADFARWWRNNRPGTQPFGPGIPVSTEQVLHPERMGRGDAPVEVRFTDDTSGVMHDDTVGELEIAILRSTLAGIDEVPTDPPMGWGGDRLRVYRSAEGPALVWYTVWDTPRDAATLTTWIAEPLAKRERAGYRTVVEPIVVSGRSGVRVVIAPGSWAGWGALPRVELR